jgi:formate hydrogenlyase subunit 6/NADH:ubiquinone oxidoreductase subunit I
MALLDWVREISEGVETTLVGMKTTASFAAENWGGKASGAMTREYPAEQPVLTERFRGHLFNNVDDCISCKLCAKACPVDCFVIDTERNAENKLRASRFDIDLTKCIYCGLCTRACPTDCLTMEGGFELDPKNTVNKHGERFLFTQRPDQLDTRMDSADVIRLNAISGKPYVDLSEADRAFMHRLEDPTGNTLVAKFGEGFYTPEEKIRVDAEREAMLKAKAEAAKAAAAKAAADKAAAEAAKAAADAVKPAAPTPGAPA